ncbi:hypothetical protein AJ88_22030 [Mesorhizobium amorphae CCBAU 01583]|nr:hypothetical protein AJ88_22030 [Mesorhizobium amorphae CCBAU 01583]
MHTIGGFAALAVSGAASAPTGSIRVMPTEWSTLSSGRAPPPRNDGEADLARRNHRSKLRADSALRLRYTACSVKRWPGPGDLLAGLATFLFSFGR